MQPIYQVAKFVFNLGMALTNDEIRKLNLKILIKEIGKKSKLAEMADTDPAYISQVLSTKGKKPRNIGDDFARKLEIACNKHRGWMDTYHPAEELEEYLSRDKTIGEPNEIGSIGVGGLNEEAKNFARNLKILMHHHHDTLDSLATRSGVNQIIISTMLSPGDNDSPNLANVASIAKAYGLQTWHLLYPNAPADILINSAIEKFVDNYAHANAETREAWGRIAEESSRYRKVNNT